MSRVLRGRFPRGRARRVSADLVDAHREADALRARVRSEIAQERAAMVAELDEVRAQIRAEVAEERAAEHVALLLAARRDGAAQHELLAADLATAAIEVAERLLGEALAADPARVRGLVRGALSKLSRARELEVVVNPADLPHAQTLPELAGASFVADPALSRGSCRIASELGGVDARLEVRLEAMRGALARGLARVAEAGDE